jgi:hypothetical protein
VCKVRACPVGPLDTEEAEEEPGDPPVAADRDEAAEGEAPDADCADPAGADARRGDAPAAVRTFDAVVRTGPGMAEVGTDGVDTLGVVTVGVVTCGVVTEGVVTFGVVTEGVVTLGVVTEGLVTVGVVSDGVVTVGVVTCGVVTFGTDTDGAVTWGVVIDGAATFGALTDGAVTEGRLRSDDAVAVECGGRTAAVPARGCATKMPSPAAAIPITTPCLFPMACPLV